LYPPALIDPTTSSDELGNNISPLADAERSDADEERIDTLLKTLIIEAEREDEDIRRRPLREAKRNECYFSNMQKFFYDEVARDYRALESVVKEVEELEDIKQINIYRPFLESLIAALSVSLPNVEFTPDDSEDSDDVETAEAYTRISELVAKHNLAPLMLIKAITLFFNQGTIFGYNYYKEDSAYGVIRKPITETNSKLVGDLQCPECGNTLGSTDIVNNKSLNPDVLKSPDIQRAAIGAAQAMMPQQTCENCNQNVTPEIAGTRIEYEDEVVGYEETPKGRSRFDIFGMTSVKIPFYARNQESIGYLILRLEDHIAKFKKVYSEFADKIGAEGGDTGRYERWSRLPLEYNSGVMKNITTLRTAWFRPWYFYHLAIEDAEFLESKYPNGVSASIIGDTIVEKKVEKLDDKWTLSFDPRSNYVHGEPHGNLLVPLADAETDIFNLGLQSIEYGIPETFAHPKTLNLQKYKETRAAPGMIVPALPPGPDKTISDGFHTLQTATLSGEYTRFAESLTQKQQFVSGAFPSIFGGAPEGSDTAAVYQESRNRALQRLQLTWQIISVFWSRLITKCVTDYAENLKEDESYSKKQNGTFVNVWVRTSQLKGKIGHVEPEVSQQIPQSWSQKKDFFMQLIQLQIPEVGQIVLHPNNIENLKQMVGMPEFYLPGECDRNKQFSEYYELSQGQSLDGQHSSVPIDIVVDDHQLQMLVLKNILVGSVGVQLYKTNPQGYQNCILHYREHEMAAQAKTIAPTGMSAPGEMPPTASNQSEG